MKGCHGAKRLMSLLLVCAQEEEEDGRWRRRARRWEILLKRWVGQKRNRHREANTARQRFLYGGKAKFVADEKFIAEAKILAK